MFEISNVLVLAYTARPYKKPDGTAMVFKSVTVRLPIEGQDELVTFATKVDMTDSVDDRVTLVLDPKIFKGECTGLAVVDVK